MADTGKAILEAILAESNPYSTPRDIVGAVQYTPYGANGAQNALGVGLGKAVLGGILDGLSRRERAADASVLAGAIPGLRADPYGYQAPAAIAGDSFDLLRSQYINDAIDREQELRDFADKEIFRDALGTRSGLYMDDIKRGRDLRETIPSLHAQDIERVLNSSRGVEASPAARPAGSDVLDQIIANQQALGGGEAVGAGNSAAATPTEDVLRGVDSEEAFIRSGRGTGADYRSMIEKQFADEQGLRKEFTTLETTTRQQLATLGLKAAVEAYKDPAGTSDYELIRRGAQAVEPGLAVRRDDEASLQGAGSLFGLSLAQMQALANGDSKLAPGVRRGIMRIIKRGYEANRETFNSTRNKYIEASKAYGYDPGRTIVFDEAAPIDQLYPDFEPFLEGAPVQTSLHPALQGGTAGNSITDVLTQQPHLQRQEGETFEQYVQRVRGAGL